MGKTKSSRVLEEQNTSLTDRLKIASSEMAVLSEQLEQVCDRLSINQGLGWEFESVGAKCQHCPAWVLFLKVGMPNYMFSKSLDAVVWHPNQQGTCKLKHIRLF